MIFVTPGPAGAPPDAGQLRVAMANPSNVLAIDDLAMMTGRSILPVVAARDDILAAIGRVSSLEGAVLGCPVEGCKKRLQLSAMIVHLNDHHEWSREQIATWLEQQNDDTRFQLAAPKGSD